MKVKKIALQLLLCCLTITTLCAQKAQEIRGVATEKFPLSYYQEQSKLWQQEIAKKPSNSYAYWQWYKAERSFLIKESKGAWPDNKKEVYGKLKPIVAAAKKQVGDSFDYNFMVHANAIEKGETTKEYLLKAYKADPDRYECYDNMMIHYVTNFDSKGTKEIAERMLKHNVFSNANLKWNYNALQTVEKNGIFISQGDMDGLPRWALQYGAGIRRDVTVISKWLLSIDEYRKTVFLRFQIPPFGKKAEDFDGQTAYVDALAVHLMKNAKQKSYMGCGTPMSFFEKHNLKKDMYLVGTAFAYSKSGLDNMNLTKQNFEEKYDLEYLFNNFQTHHEDEMVKTWMNITYIPGLMKMKKHYEDLNEEAKVNYYSKLIERIAEESGRKEEIMSWY